MNAISGRMSFGSTSLARVRMSRRVMFFATRHGYDFISPVFLLAWPVLAPWLIMTVREPEPALRD